MVCQFPCHHILDPGADLNSDTSRPPWTDSWHQLKWASATVQTRHVLGDSIFQVPSKCFKTISSDAIRPLSWNRPALFLACLSVTIHPGIWVFATTFAVSLSRCSSIIPEQAWCLWTVCLTDVWISKALLGRTLSLHPSELVLSSSPLHHCLVLTSRYRSHPNTAPCGELVLNLRWKTSMISACREAVASGAASR
ncbi:hypothetical protein LZ32DRAFT_179927 [Colletotrichum eremochloae]|nr:hypothetical protein LZ32DRAFT_179927 [Colletotrichum eremochloae]